MKFCLTLNYNSINLNYISIHAIVLDLDVGYWGSEHRVTLDRIPSHGYLRHTLNFGFLSFFGYFAFKACLRFACNLPLDIVQSHPH